MAADKKKRRKRRQGPQPLAITPVAAASAYQRDWTVHDLRALLNDLMPYTEGMPVELWDRLRCLIVGQMMVPMEVEHKIRHRVACEAIDDVGWDSGFEEAAKRLGNTIGPDAIERSYKLIERSLPPEQQRKKRRKR